ncbi:hypothetical protein DFJ58DRAFT_86714 [Suillus subalutaceus]|uniref:uncharacterized protein n=1 Tax=Suillus subalutaceus TaxID=48586 RepID=UPI001B8815BB|nr:uncharacterized protein DFJ58DRAFT_86714 [Suillus subalutaceus]KAG1840833.1 hypothetical protein DFJ58DRAFT_86714 [Suillus subalutaceus]
MLDSPNSVRSRDWELLGPNVVLRLCDDTPGNFCLGMVYNMNPFDMPPAFCKAQTFIIYYSAHSLTGVCAAFTMATTSAVVWPSSVMATASSTLAWRNRYLLPIVVFPLGALGVAVPVLLSLHAIQPTDDLHCDSSHPIWGRFLGYAGIVHDSCGSMFIPVCNSSPPRIQNTHGAS